jgi:hypothetical protein
MNAQLIREYRERWQAVAAVELEEQRAASVALRWQQLNAIVRMAVDLGLPLKESDKEETIVWQRWARLKGV